MRNTPAPNTRYVTLSRNYVYHLPCPASLSPPLSRAPTPPTQAAETPNFSILQFPSDCTIFSISTRTSHTRSNSVISDASSLVNYIGLTSFQASTTGQIFSLQADARLYSPPRNPTDSNKQQCPILLQWLGGCSQFPLVASQIYECCEQLGTIICKHAFEWWIRPWVLQVISGKRKKKGWILLPLGCV